MATHRDEFEQAEAFSPEREEAPRPPRGCLFYGCLFSSILALFLMIGVGTVSYLLYRAANQFILENTASEPRELPKVEMPEQDRQTLQQRTESFRKAIDAGEPAEPLVLTADEINALIEQQPNWKGQVYVTMEGGSLKGKLSVSLEKLSKQFENVGITLLRGRYFNGEVGVKPSIKNGTLQLSIESVKVNGQSLSGEAVTQLQTMAVEMIKGPEIVEVARKIESLEIKDGKMIIKGQSRSGPAKPTPRDLPDNVLAPQGAGEAAARER